MPLKPSDKKTEPYKGAKYAAFVMMGLFVLVSIGLIVYTGQNPGEMT